MIARAHDCPAAVGGCLRIGLALVLAIRAATTAMAAEPPRTVASVLRTLTGGPARVVWCRDIGDGTDVAAMGDRLLLMGLDTEDNRGERPIIEAPGNYAKPSLTANGDRVVYSDRRTETVYVVNWDGSNRRAIGRGFALATWRNPDDGSDWVYAGTDVVQLKAPCFRTILRWRLDDPGRRELVWNRTVVSQDFQPSGDGRYGGSSFPWPACGVAALPNGAWHQYGNGCWPCLAPDNNPYAWIFDGQHRRLYLYNLQAIHDWWLVDISSAPGVEGYEVYHPRWANDSRFMTMTGPYKAGEGANRILGGGEAVEVYVGRFAEDYRTITDWVRVTNNRQADFYPHLWRKTETGRDLPALEVKTLELPESPPGTVWPGYDDGLQFVWNTRKQNNAIRLANGGSRVCRVEPRGQARYGRGFEMRLGRGAFEAETGDDALGSACMASGEMSFEAVITPEGGPPVAASPICTFGGPDGINFELAQAGNRLVCRLRTGSALIEERICALPPGVASHLILSYAPGRLVAYLNGKEAGSSDAITGRLAGWVPARLRFGDPTATGSRWRGGVEAVAIYNRWITREEAGLHARLAGARSAAGPPPAQSRVRARLLEAASIPTPAGIAPYRRAMTANVYELESVLEGESLPARFMAAHWVIMDAQRLPTAARDPGELYEILLEDYDSHPELEGERLVVEAEDLTLPLYIDVGD